jgi:hypothetical protein
MLAERYWRIRLAQVKEALEANDFAAFIAQDQEEAKEIVLRQIVPQTGAKRISAGDSMTCINAGLFETLANEPGVEFIDPFPEKLPLDEMMERLRQAFLVDLFIAGTNAVTEAGQLVNLDMVGNRIGGITFGPKKVAILVGRNKVVATLEEGMERVRNYAAPANAARLGRKTPCAKTAHCEDCSSPDRICNAWSILEKSYPGARNGRFDQPEPGVVKSTTDHQPLSPPEAPGDIRSRARHSYSVGRIGFSARTTRHSRRSQLPGATDRVFG